MTIFLAAAGTLLSVLAAVVGHITIRIARSNAAVYEMNRTITGSFWRAARGRVTPIQSGSTDFHVNHFLEPRVDKLGKAIGWERAGSLSDEAVDGVLTRQH